MIFSNLSFRPPEFISDELGNFRKGFSGTFWDLRLNIAKFYANLTILKLTFTVRFALRLDFTYVNAQTLFNLYWVNNFVGLLLHYLRFNKWWKMFWKECVLMYAQAKIKTYCLIFTKFLLLLCLNKSQFTVIYINT